MAAIMEQIRSAHIVPRVMATLINLERRDRVEEFDVDFSPSLSRQRSHVFFKNACPINNTV